MTDMRATERLLEVIERDADAIRQASTDYPITKTSERILTAITELRRRGDTLVRAADLRLLITPAWQPGKQWTRRDHEAYDRLKNALGGKL